MKNMKPTYKTLAPRQRELYHIAVMNTIDRGYTTAKIVTRLSLALNPDLNVSTPEGWDTKAHADAAFVIQAMRNDGWIETTRKAGMKTVIYRMIRE